jgi:hypothetical protein
VAATLLALGIPQTAGAGASPVDPAAASTAAATEPSAPLRISITRLTPGSLPEEGPVRIQGTVTNLSEEVWSDIRVFPFAGDNPITSSGPQGPPPPPAPPQGGGAGGGGV